MPRIRLRGRHVRGHQDQASGVLDIWARRNVLMDERATEVYSLVSSAAPIPLSDAPLPPVCLCDNTVAHDFTTQCQEHILGPPLLEFWTRLGRFGDVPDPSTAVAWPSYAAALAELPQSRRHWTIKSTAQRSAVGVEMRRRKAWSHALCPVCSSVDETSTHVFRCQDVRVTSRWVNVLTQLDQWMARHFTQPSAARALLLRLHEWIHDLPETPFHSTVPGLEEALHQQARLGWDGLLYGFWSPAWVEMQDLYYRFLGRRNTGRRWLTLLIQQLLDIA